MIFNEFEKKYGLEWNSDFSASLPYSEFEFTQNVEGITYDYMGRVESYPEILVEGGIDFAKPVVTYRLNCGMEEVTADEFAERTGINISELKAFESEIIKLFETWLSEETE